MKERTFNNGLIVKHRKSAIILENKKGKNERETKFTYAFSSDEFIKFMEYLILIANESWKNITPKEATSMGSDYNEYYDRKYDDNGYISITDSEIRVTAPYWSVDTLYQFNKPKIQSFIYDLQKKLKPINQTV